MTLRNEYASLDATALADLVRKKQVKPIELVDAALERIERLNPTLNAVITPMFDDARQAAQKEPPRVLLPAFPFCSRISEPPTGE